MITANRTYQSNPYSNFRVTKSVSFSSNPNSKLLKFGSDDFFINMKGYGKNRDWAKKVIKLTNRAVFNMREGKNSDEVLIGIANDMKDANSFCSEKFKKNHTGILRTKRLGYGDTGEWAYRDLATSYKSKLHEDSQYSPYEERFDKVFKQQLKKPYDNIGMTTISHTKENKLMLHGNAFGINESLNRVGGKYFNLRRDYILKPENVTKEKLNDINSDVAEIRWLMAHATPWERGSDAISNSFMRALYKSMGIKTYPAKPNISFDLEAYCTELPEYKKNFASYFEKPPEIVE